MPNGVSITLARGSPAAFLLMPAGAEGDACVVNDPHVQAKWQGFCRVLCGGWIVLRLLFVPDSLSTGFSLCVLV